MSTKYCRGIVTATRFSLSMRILVTTNFLYQVRSSELLLDPINVLYKDRTRISDSRRTRIMTHEEHWQNPSTSHRLG